MDNELEQMIIKQKIKIKQLKKEIANNKEIVNEYSYNGQRYNNQNIDLSKSIKAIYLGVDFDKNKKAEKLYEIILDIRNSNEEVKFDIYRMNRYGVAEKQI